MRSNISKGVVRNHINLINKFFLGGLWYLNKNFQVCLIYMEFFPGDDFLGGIFFHVNFFATRSPINFLRLDFSVKFIRLVGNSQPTKISHMEIPAQSQHRTWRKVQVSFYLVEICAMYFPFTCPKLPTVIFLIKVIAKFSQWPSQKKHWIRVV